MWPIIFLLSQSVTFVQTFQVRFFQRQVKFCLQRAIVSFFSIIFERILRYTENNLSSFKLAEKLCTSLHCSHICRWIAAKQTSYSSKWSQITLNHFAILESCIGKRNMNAKLRRCSQFPIKILILRRILRGEKKKKNGKFTLFFLDFQDSTHP